MSVFGVQCGLEELYDHFFYEACNILTLNLYCYLNIITQYYVPELVD